MNARRILVYHGGHIGDHMVTLPSLHLVRQTFPAAEITALTNFSRGHGSNSKKLVSLASVVEGTGLIDNYIEYPISLRHPRAVLKLRRQIRERRFDHLIYLVIGSHLTGGTTRLFRDSLFFLSCGIVRQVGIPFSRHDRNLDPIEGTGLYRREGERLVGCLRSLGRPDLTEDRWWDLRLTDDESREAQELLRDLGNPPRFLALCAGTPADVKDWTDPNWSSLLDALTREYPDVGLVGIGSRDESDRTSRLLAAWRGPALNLCGATRGPRIAAAVLQRAALYLGYDSGPMHLAAAVRTPCVAIFSAQAPPGEWFPRGQNHRVLYHKTECFGCRLSKCVVHQKKCILSITVDEVCNAVKSQLSMNM